MHLHGHSPYFRPRLSTTRTNSTLVRRNTEAEGANLVKPILIVLLVIFSLMFLAWLAGVIHRKIRARKLKARGQGNVLRMGSLRKTQPRQPVELQKRRPLFGNQYEAAQYAGSNLPRYPQSSYGYPNQARGQQVYRGEWVSH